MAFRQGFTRTTRQIGTRGFHQTKSLLDTNKTKEGANGTFTDIFSKIKGAAENEQSAAELKKSFEELSKKTESIREKTRGGLGTLRDVAAKATSVVGEHAKKAAETTSKAAEGVKSTVSEAAESEFVKAAREQAQAAKVQAQKATAQASESFSQQTSQFFTKKEGEGEEGTKEEGSGKKAEAEGQSAGAAASGKASSEGMMGKMKGAFSYVVDAYKEEFRLARMTETEVEEEAAKARAEAAAAKQREEEKEAKLRGEDWVPNTEERGLMVKKREQTSWERRFKWFKEHPASSSFFNKYEKFKSSPLMSKGRERLEDMRERWETSESPVVQRLQDMHSSMTQQTEQALAMTEIRKRDPNFDMIRFSRKMKETIPVILKAYLKGDVEALKTLPVGSEMIERMSGQIAAWKAEGTFVDHTILDTSEVEMVEMKMFGENPIIIIRCQCQQINCVRDKFENVLEGAPDDIQSVHYGWAMEQDPIGSGVDGGPPGWTVREMMIQGMQAIV